MRELYTWEMGDPPLECVYTLPSDDAFKTVNAAIFDVLIQVYRGRRLDRDETEGAVVYALPGAGWHAHLSLLYTTAHVVTLRMRVLLPDDPIERIVWIRDIGPRAGPQVVALFHMFHGSIANLLRTAAMALGPPAPPPATSLPAVFTWQEIYHPTMRDSDLAELIGLDHQTIRNARSEMRKLKRVKKGKVKPK